MNKYKRRRLTDAVSKLEEASVIVTDVCDEEQSSYDNMPESLQSSENGSVMEDAISEMTDAISSIDEAIQSLNNIN